MSGTIFRGPRWIILGVSLGMWPLHGSRDENDGKQNGGDGCESREHGFLLFGPVRYGVGDMAPLPSRAAKRSTSIPKASDQNDLPAA